MNKMLDTKSFTLGRKGFAKISAIEGIHLSREMEKQFASFDQKGMSASERRQAIARDYGRKG